MVVTLLLCYLSRRMPLLPKAEGRSVLCYLVATHGMCRLYEREYNEDGWWTWKGTFFDENIVD